jgi:hypothetical protein
MSKRHDYFEEHTASHSFSFQSNTRPSATVRSLSFFLVLMDTDSSSSGIWMLLSEMSRPNAVIYCHRRRQTLDISTGL